MVTLPDDLILVKVKVSCMQPLVEDRVVHGRVMVLLNIGPFAGVDTSGLAYPGPMRGHEPAKHKPISHSCPFGSGKDSCIRPHIW